MDRPKCTLPFYKHLKPLSSCLAFQKDLPSINGRLDIIRSQDKVESKEKSHLASSFTLSYLNWKLLQWGGCHGQDHVTIESAS